MPSFILSITPLQTLSGLSDTLGHILLMNVQINGDEAQMLTDSGQSGERLCVSRKGAGWPLSLLRVLLPL